MNLHGSPRFEGRKRKRYKKTVIPRGGWMVKDECVDDDRDTYGPEEVEPCDVEITDEITDTTIEDIIGT